MTSPPRTKRELYGAIVDHLEPDDARQVVVPVPKDRATLEAIGLPVIRGMDLRESAYAELAQSRALLDTVTGDDAHDAAIALDRLTEIDEHPDTLVRGTDLDKRLAKLT